MDIGRAVRGMQFAGRRLSFEQRRFFSFFCMGFVLGILVMNIGKSIFLKETGLFDEYTLYQMRYMTVDSNALFCYIFRKRISRMLALTVISTTYLGFVACMGTSLWYGMSAGVFLTTLTLRYGVKGILLAIVSMFPQYLLYVPAVLALLSWCEELFRGIYTRGEYNMSDKKLLVKKAGRLVVILSVITLGCLLEGYVNPYLLLGYLKIF